MVGWDKNGSYVCVDVWMCLVDATGSGWGPVAGSCERGDEPSVCSAT